MKKIAAVLLIAALIFGTIVIGYAIVKLFLLHWVAGLAALCVALMLASSLLIDLCDEKDSE